MDKSGDLAVIGTKIKLGPNEDRIKKFENQKKLMADKFFALKNVPKKHVKLKDPYGDGDDDVSSRAPLTVFSHSTSGLSDTTSIERLWQYYKCSDRESKTTTIDIYKHLLIELRNMLGEGLILYGSAALWLEGYPRPDASEELNIKDLDMSMDYEAFLEQVKWKERQTKENAFEQLKLLLNGLDVVKLVLNTGRQNATSIIMTSGGTVEIISPDKKVQFSINWKTPEEQRVLAELSALVRIETQSDGKGAEILMSGMKFIKHRITADDGLIRKTLFRPDKTAKIITYMAMCIADDNKETERLMRFTENLIDSKDLLNELKRLQINKLKPDTKLAAAERTDDEIGVVFKTLICSLLALNEKIEASHDRIKPPSKANKYGLPDDWYEAMMYELNETNLNNFCERLSDEELELLRKKKVKNTYVSEFKDMMTDKYLEEAQVGTKIFLLDNIFYNADMVKACKWIDKDFRTKLLEALQVMAIYVQGVIVEQVENSPNYV